MCVYIRLYTFKRERVRTLGRNDLLKDLLLLWFVISLSASFLADFSENIMPFMYRCVRNKKCVNKRQTVC